MGSGGVEVALAESLGNNRHRQNLKSCMDPIKYNFKIKFNITYRIVRINIYICYNK